MSTAIGVDDYVLGTDDHELARLGLQHRVWRSRALDAWRRAGFNAGQPLLEEFVQTVMRAWRAEGGEPDIGRPLVAWLEESGFRIESLRPFIDVITPSDFMFQWPKAFVASGTRRLVDLGELTAERAEAIRSEFAEQAAAPHARMVIPAVLEIVAKKE